MNWKIIAALGVPSGLLLGGLSTLGILSGWIQLLLWIFLAVMWRQVIMVQAPHKPFVHAFLIAVLAGLISGNVIALNKEVFFEFVTFVNATGEPVSSSDVPMSFFVLQGGINGLLFGLLAGGIAGWKTRAQAAAQAAALADDSEE